MINEALETALQGAPTSQTLSQLARKTNEALGLEWSDAKWRGIWKNHPSTAFLVKKKLGEQLNQHIHGQKAHLYGDMRGATVGDAHAPYHDPRAIELAAQILRWWKPDVLVHNGDNADFSALSKFNPNPARKFSVQEEIDLWGAHVAIPFKQAVGSKCRTFFVPGNHDLRFLKLLWAQPELFSVRSLHLPALFETEKLGMEYVGYAVVVDDLLEISHGTKTGTYPARGELQKRGYSISTNTNHVHRADRHEYNAPYGPPLIAQSNGCLCKLDPDYLVDPNWAHGITLWEIYNHDLWLWPVIFARDYTANVQGKRFHA